MPSQLIVVYRRLALYENSEFEGLINDERMEEKQQSLQSGLAPDTWMLGGIALIVTLAVLLLFMLRCAVYFVPRCFGYEAASRLEGPGHSLGMYSLDLKVHQVSFQSSMRSRNSSLAHTKNQGYANVGYLHRESVTYA